MDSNTHNINQRYFSALSPVQFSPIRSPSTRPQSTTLNPSRNPQLSLLPSQNDYLDDFFAFTSQDDDDDGDGDDDDDNLEEGSDLNHLSSIPHSNRSFLAYVSIQNNITNIMNDEMINEFNSHADKEGDQFHLQNTPTIHTHLSPQNKTLKSMEHTDVNDWNAKMNSLHISNDYNETSLLLRSFIFSSHISTPSTPLLPTPSPTDLIYRSFLLSLANSSLDGNKGSNYPKPFFPQSTKKATKRRATTTTSTPPRKVTDSNRLNDVHVISPLDSTITTQQTSLFSWDNLQRVVNQHSIIDFDHENPPHDSMINFHHDVPTIFNEKEYLAQIEDNVNNFFGPNANQSLLSLPNNYPSISTQTTTQTTTATRNEPKLLTLGSTFEYLLASQCLFCSFCQTSLLFATNQLSTDMQKYLTVDLPAQTSPLHYQSSAFGGNGNSMTDLGSYITPSTTSTTPNKTPIKSPPTNHLDTPPHLRKSRELSRSNRKSSPYTAMLGSIDNGGRRQHVFADSDLNPLVGPYKLPSFGPEREFVGESLGKQTGRFGMGDGGDVDGGEKGEMSGRENDENNGAQIEEKNQDICTPVKKNLYKRRLNNKDIVKTTTTLGTAGFQNKVHTDQFEAKLDSSTNASKNVGIEAEKKPFTTTPGNSFENQPSYPQGRTSNNYYASWDELSWENSTLITDSTTIYEPHQFEVQTLYTQQLCAQRPDKLTLHCQKSGKKANQTDVFLLFQNVLQKALKAHIYILECGHLVHNSCLHTHLYAGFNYNEFSQVLKAENTENCTQNCTQNFLKKFIKNSTIPCLLCAKHQKFFPVYQLNPHDLLFSVLSHEFDGVQDDPSSEMGFGGHSQGKWTHGQKFVKKSWSEGPIGGWILRYMYKSMVFGDTESVNVMGSSRFQTDNVTQNGVASRFQKVQLKNYIFTHQGLLTNYMKRIYYQGVKIFGEKLGFELEQKQSRYPSRPNLIQYHPPFKSIKTKPDVGSGNDYSSQLPFAYYLLKIMGEKLTDKEQTGGKESDPSLESPRKRSISRHFSILINNIPIGFMDYLIESGKIRQNESKKGKNNKNAEKIQHLQMSPIWFQDPILAKRNSEIKQLNHDNNEPLHICPDLNPHTSLHTTTFFPISVPLQIPLHIPSVDPNSVYNPNTNGSGLSNKGRALSPSSKVTQVPVYMLTLLLTLYQYHIALLPAQVVARTSYSNNDTSTQLLGENASQYITILKNQFQLLGENKNTIGELLSRISILKEKVVRKFVQRVQIYEFVFDFQHIKNSFFRTYYLPIYLSLLEWNRGLVVPKLRIDTPADAAGTPALNPIISRKSRSTPYQNLGLNPGTRFSIDILPAISTLDHKEQSYNIIKNLFLTAPVFFPVSLLHTFRGKFSKTRSSSDPSFRLGLLTGALHQSLKNTLVEPLYSLLSDQIKIKQTTSNGSNSPLPHFDIFSHLQYFSSSSLRIFTPPQVEIAKQFHNFEQPFSLFSSELLLALVPRHTPSNASKSEENTDIPPLVLLSCLLLANIVDYIFLLLSKNPLYYELLGFMRQNTTVYIAQQLQLHNTDGMPRRDKDAKPFGEKNKTKQHSDQTVSGGLRDKMKELSYSSILIYLLLSSSDVFSYPILPIDLIELKIHKKSKEISQISAQISILVLKRQLFQTLHPMLPNPKHNIGIDHDLDDVNDFETHNDPPTKSSQKPLNVQTNPQRQLHTSQPRTYIPADHHMNHKAPPQSTLPDPAPKSSAPTNMVSKNPFLRSNQTQKDAFQAKINPLETSTPNLTHSSTQLSSLPKTTMIMIPNPLIPSQKPLKEHNKRTQVASITYNSTELVKNHEKNELDKIEDLLNSSAYLKLFSPSSKKARDEVKHARQNRLSLDLNVGSGSIDRNPSNMFDNVEHTQSITMLTIFDPQSDHPQVHPVLDVEPYFIPSQHYPHNPFETSNHQQPSNPFKSTSTSALPAFNTQNASTSTSELIFGSKSSRSMIVSETLTFPELIKNDKYDNFLIARNIALNVFNNPDDLIHLSYLVNSATLGVMGSHTGDFPEFFRSNAAALDTEHPPATIFFEKGRNPSFSVFKASDILPFQRFLQSIQLDPLNRYSKLFHKMSLLGLNSFHPPQIPTKLSSESGTLESPYENCILLTYYDQNIHSVDLNDPFAPAQDKNALTNTTKHDMLLLPLFPLEDITVSLYFNQIEEALKTVLSDPTLNNVCTPTSMFDEYDDVFDEPSHTHFRLGGEGHDIWDTPETKKPFKSLYRKNTSTTDSKLTDIAPSTPKSPIGPQNSTNSDEILIVKTALSKSHQEVITQLSLFAHTTQIILPSVDKTISDQSNPDTSFSNDELDDVSLSTQLSKLPQWFHELSTPNRSNSLLPSLTPIKCYTDLNTFQLLSDLKAINCRDCVVVEFKESDLNRLLDPDSLISTPNYVKHDYDVDIDPVDVSSPVRNGANKPDCTITPTTRLKNEFIDVFDSLNMADRDNITIDGSSSGKMDQKSLQIPLAQTVKNNTFIYNLFAEELLGEVVGNDLDHVVFDEPQQKHQGDVADADLDSLLAKEKIPRQLLEAQLPGPISSTSHCFILLYKPFYLPSTSSHDRDDDSHSYNTSFKPTKFTHCDDFFPSHLAKKRSLPTQWLDNVFSPQFLALDLTISQYKQKFYHPINNYINQYSQLLSSYQQLIESTSKIGAHGADINAIQATIYQEHRKIREFESQVICDFSENTLLYSPHPMFSIQLPLAEMSKPIDKFYADWIDKFNLFTHRNKDNINGTIPKLIQIEALLDQISPNTTFCPSLGDNVHHLSQELAANKTDIPNVAQMKELLSTIPDPSHYTTSFFQSIGSPNANSIKIDPPTHYERLSLLMEQHAEEILQLQVEIEEIVTNKGGKYGPTDDMIDDAVDMVLDSIEEVLEELYGDDESAIILELKKLQGKLLRIVLEHQNEKHGKSEKNSQNDNKTWTLADLFNGIFVNYIEYSKQQRKQREFLLEEQNYQPGDTQSLGATLLPPIPNPDIGGIIRIQTEKITDEVVGAFPRIDKKTQLNPSLIADLEHSDLHIDSNLLPFQHLSSQKDGGDTAFGGNNDTHNDQKLSNNPANNPFSRQNRILPRSTHTNIHSKRVDNQSEMNLPFSTHSKFGQILNKNQPKSQPNRTNQPHQRGSLNNPDLNSLRSLFNPSQANSTTNPFSSHSQVPIPRAIRDRLMPDAVNMGMGYDLKSSTNDNKDSIQIGTKNTKTDKHGRALPPKMRVVGRTLTNIAAPQFIDLNALVTANIHALNTNGDEDHFPKNSANSKKGAVPTKPDPITSNHGVHNGGKAQHAFGDGGKASGIESTDSRWFDDDDDDANDDGVFTSTTQRIDMESKKGRGVPKKLMANGQDVVDYNDESIYHSKNKSYPTVVKKSNPYLSSHGDDQSESDIEVVSFQFNAPLTILNKVEQIKKTGIDIDAKIGKNNRLNKDGGMNGDVTSNAVKTHPIRARKNDKIPASELLLQRFNICGSSDDSDIQIIE